VAVLSVEWALRVQCEVWSVELQVSFAKAHHFRTKPARTGSAGARRMAHASSIDEKGL
jgi:hypothetical protein